MRRFILFLICALLGVGMLAAGLLIPVHLRAVDARVLEHAGKGSPSLVDQGLVLTRESKLGAAQLILQTCQQQRLPGTEKLKAATDELARQHARWQVWGGPEPRFESIFEPDKRLPESDSQPFTQYVIREANRQRVLAQLNNVANRAVQELMQFRAVTNPVIFTASQSSSGQALDAAVSVCGLLLEGNHLKKSFADELDKLAAQALAGGGSGRFEQALLDLTSLGQRLNWGQMVVFVGQVKDAETLRFLVHLMRQDESRLPVLFSAVMLSGNPGAVADYLMSFSASGWRDLGFGLRYGTGGFNELLRRNQRICVSSWPYVLALDAALQMPWLAQTAKWLLYLAAGFLFAAALHFARPAVIPLERPLQVPGFHIAREVLFALGFLVATLLFTEPFLAQDSQRLTFPPFQLRMPTVMTVLRPDAITNQAKTSIMNQLSLLTLLLFFVLQALLYTACLVKLAEIRRQKVPPRIKLRLLENEDHLFDAGLYLGFVGTIISLILVSLGVIKPSLMAAYSSTSFGIIFVSIFKIFHVRPARRKWLLESEAQAAQAAVHGAAPTLVTP